MKIIVILLSLIWLVGCKTQKVALARLPNHLAKQFPSEVRLPVDSGTATEDLIAYDEEPQIRVEYLPKTGSRHGGERLKLVLDRATEVTEVRIGGETCLGLSSTGPREVSCEVPPREPGLVRVTVQFAEGSFDIGSYQYMVRLMSTFTDAQPHEAKVYDVDLVAKEIRHVRTLTYPSDVYPYRVLVNPKQPTLYNLGVGFQNYTFSTLKEAEGAQLQEWDRFTALESCEFPRIDPQGKIVAVDCSAYLRTFRLGSDGRPDIGSMKKLKISDSAYHDPRIYVSPDGNRVFRKGFTKVMVWDLTEPSLEIHPVEMDLTFGYHLLMHPDGNYFYATVGSPSGNVPIIRSYYYDDSTRTLNPLAGYDITLGAVSFSALKLVNRGKTILGVGNGCNFYFMNLDPDHRPTLSAIVQPEFNWVIPTEGPVSCGVIDIDDSGLVTVRASQLKDGISVNMGGALIALDFGSSAIKEVVKLPQGMALFNLLFY